MPSFKAFIERCQNLHSDWLAADPTQKRAITKKILLNLVVEGAEIRTMSWIPPFANWLEPQEFLNGGGKGRNLESSQQGPSGRRRIAPPIGGPRAARISREI